QRKRKYRFCFCRSRNEHQCDRLPISVNESQIQNRAQNLRNFCAFFILVCRKTFSFLPPLYSSWNFMCFRLSKWSPKNPGPEQPTGLLPSPSMPFSFIWSLGSGKQKADIIVFSSSFRFF